jgi:8-oxo-dGTP diphosphatase
MPVPYVSCLATWPTGSVRLEWIPGASAGVPITGAHGFCFSGDRVLMCHIAHRGLSIPGGHPEPGESPEACLVREVREETGAELEHVVLLGHIVADHSVNPSYAGTYPRRAAIAIFAAAIARLGELEPTSESTDRQLVPCQQVPLTHQGWNEVLAAAYDGALGMKDCRLQAAN